MQWSLVAVIHIVSALFGASCASAENGNGQISSVFEAFGYSPACVASALTSCEFSSTKEISVDVVDSIEATKSLLQEMKSEIKAIRQEMKSAEKNSSSVVKTLLQEIESERGISLSEIKAICQEMNSEGENSSSVGKNLLQEMQSAEENSSSIVKSFLREIKSEIKVILRDVKRELENVTDNSQSRDCVIPGGTTATPEGKKLPKNCAELKLLGETSSGVQTVYPYGSLNPKQTTVYCDQVTDEGGWTVIQSRSPIPVRENFTRNWCEYVKGFGDLNGEFWLGLDNIHALTNSSKMELRIDLEDAEGQRRWALYSTFTVGDAASKYVLRIGGYSGSAGDGMVYSNHIYENANEMPFSTFDKDNDLYSGLNCAELYHGGWWFNRCAVANLNGRPIVGKAPIYHEILWLPFRGWGHSMKKANMKLRPVSPGF